MNVTYSKSVAVRKEVDVFVAGGGPAGVAAAVAAARQGARVYLAEAHSCLGGMGTAGLVPVFMSFWDGVNFLAGGVGREILNALFAVNGTYPREGSAIKAEVLKRVYDEYAAAAKVDFSFYTHVIDVIRQGSRLEAVLCSGKSGVFAVKAAMYIDATGDGDLAAFAGAPYDKGDDEGRMMPGTLCSLWSNIHWPEVRQSGLGSGASRVEEAIRDGVFTLEDRHLPGMWQVSERMGGGNIGHTFDLDGTDEASLTRALIWGRKSLLEYERYYKEYLPGFQDMELAATGSLLGVRETRRIRGDYTLTIDDFHARARFDDEIGRFSYPVDIHIARPDRASFDKFKKEITENVLPKGENYGIPYRCLTPAGLDNLLVAGRCISADRQMQSSIRVMPCCYITGQAAGVAAALAAQKAVSTREVGVRELQSRLLALGAFLPHFKDSPA